MLRTDRNGWIELSTDGAPNAGCQKLPEAGVERALEIVGCMHWVDLSPCAY